MALRIGIRLPGPFFVSWRVGGWIMAACKAFAVFLAAMIWWSMILAYWVVVGMFLLTRALVSIAVKDARARMKERRRQAIQTAYARSITATRAGVASSELLAGSPDSARWAQYDVQWEQYLHDVATWNQQHPDRYIIPEPRQMASYPWSGSGPQPRRRSQ